MLVGTYRYKLRVLLRQDVDLALRAYKSPRSKRIPKQAANQPLFTCMARLSSSGQLTFSDCNERPLSARRAAFSKAGRRLHLPVSIPVGFGAPAAIAHDSAGDPNPPVFSGCLNPKHLKNDKPPCAQAPRTVVPHPQPENSPRQCANVATAGASTPFVRDCCTSEESCIVEGEGSGDHGCTGMDKEGLRAAVYEEVDWVTLEHMPVEIHLQSSLPACIGGPPAQ